jgi:hypothetical protein
MGELVVVVVVDRGRGAVCVVDGRAGVVVAPSSFCLALPLPCCYFYYSISPCLTLPYLQISGRTYCYVRIYLFGEMIFYYRVCTQMRFNYTSFGVQYCIYEWLKLLRGRF